MKKFFLLLAASAMLIGCTNKPATTSTTTTENTNSGGKSKVMLYSSLKEQQLEALKEGFEAAHPEYSLDYYAAGTSKVATKIATEKQSGQIATDLVWIGDPSNYVTFKEQGILEAY
ncbi:MAG: extracellular solute-binding protein, partial [Solobacterium sp.]|nr:extracellular solute-binding protein [Solobacterium sp.]